MNDRIEDGGPAYPFPEVRDPVTGCGIMQGASGMSLRDWFAGQALISMGTWMPQYTPEGDLIGEVSNLANPAIQRARSAWAYAHADAMLAARKGGQS